MSSSLQNLAGTGLEVIDLSTDPDFAKRRRHDHNTAAQMEAMSRLASAFVADPDTLLQQLVQSAIDLCQADSAGISLKLREEDGSETYNWVATAGEYAHFLNAKLPSFPSACAVCIERARPQIFRVTDTFFKLMKVDAPIVTDGILIPWEVDGTHGTIWIMSHSRLEAFDTNDARVMEMLSNFAAMAVRQQRQQKLLITQATAAAAANMANDLAHQINNPLQSLTNSVFIAQETLHGPDAQALLPNLSADLDRLSTLTSKLLAVPVEAARRS